MQSASIHDSKGKRALASDLTVRTADVLVVGAGPTGLALATALMLRGLHVEVIDAQTAGANTSRAAVVHARTLETLESIGVVEPLVSRGVRALRFTLRDRDRVLAPIAFDDLPTRYPYALMISQAETEGVLHARLRELGGQVHWGRRLKHVEQRDGRVTAHLEDGAVLRARYLVGADGMHSTVRESIGVAFEGDSYAQSFSLADVRLSGGAPDDEIILYFSPAGLVVVAPLPDGVHRIVATTDAAPESPDLAFVQALLDARGPKRARLVACEVLWGSRFRVRHRIARSLHVDRILLAGDAAHVHSPAGGQGMNTGIQDAIVLAQALAAAVCLDDESLLQDYEIARRAVAAEVVRFADLLTRLATASSGLRPFRNALLRMLAHVAPFRRRLARRLSGLVYRPSLHVDERSAAAPSGELSSKTAAS